MSALARIAAAALALGATAARGDPPPALEPVTVTTRRAPEDQARVPAALSVVGRDDVQRARPQLGLDEALGPVPGLFFQDRWNFAQDLRIASRGFGARSGFGIRGLRLYVDGVPATLPDGQTQVDDLDLGSIGRVEVLRGPSSALWGPSAGGVIRIESEAPPDDPYVEGRVAIGGHGYEKAQLKTAGRSGDVDWLLSLSRLQLDGWRDHSATLSGVGNARLRWRPDERSELALLVAAVDSPRADDPGGLARAERRAGRRRAAPANERFDAGEAVEQQRVALAWRRELGARDELSARVHGVRRQLDNWLPFESDGAVVLERAVAGGGVEWAHAGSLLGRAHRLGVGLDVDAQRDDRRRLENRRGRRGAMRLDQDEDVTAWGVFAHDTVELRPDLALTAGARFDRVRFEVDDAHLADGDDSGALDFDAASPALALFWSLAPGLGIYAAASTSFETPTTTELARPEGGGFDDSLDEQTALSFELGAKGLLPGRLRFEAAVFRIAVRDELVPYELPDRPERSFFRNAGRSTREGVELGLAVEPLAGLVASLAYTGSWFRFDRFSTPDGDFGGDDIPGVPRHQLHAALSFDHASGWHAWWEVLWVGDFFADDANRVRAGSHVASSLNVSRRFALGRFEVEPFAGVTNLFDREFDGNVRINAAGGRYFEPAPGRAVHGGVSVRCWLGRRSAHGSDS